MLSLKKTMLSLFFYWIVLVIAPFWLAYVFAGNDSVFNISGVIMIYIIFVAPFLYFIPYKVVGPKNKKEKVYFIIWGLVAPYMLLYSFLFYKVVITFRDSNFPF